MINNVSRISPNYLLVKKNILLSFTVFVILAGCKKADDSTPAEMGQIVFNFYHNVDGNEMQTDTLIYTNEAGNLYEVNEIQYFISDVVLYLKNGGSVMVDAEHYIDTDIQTTQSWTLPDDIKAAEYESISFIFGLNELKNITGAFPNPPEVNMFWPVHLGGGYHYMKLNGKYLDVNEEVSPFNFHLGIGQDTLTTPTTFIQNYFVVNIPNSSFDVAVGKTTEITIIMNLENWFRDPNTWDHDVIGTKIMQNQTAMHMACQNGHDVFTMEVK